MKIVYDTLGKPVSGVGSYEKTGRYPSLGDAMAALGLPDEKLWERTPSENWAPKAAPFSGRMLIVEEREAENDAERIELAVDLGFGYGVFDGGHHKMWVIDQMLRTLLGDKYAGRVQEQTSGEDGPDTYHWDTGIAP